MTPRRPLLPAVEVALALITLAVVLGMSRLFTGGGWLGPLMVNAVAAHLLTSVSRRRGLTLLSTALLTAVAGALVTTWTLYGSTTSLGVPNLDTLSAMRTDLDLSWSLYQSAIAPAPATTGFVLASAIAVWCVAFVADWAAFRLWVPFEATLPAGTIFLFTSLLGADRGRGWAVALFAGSLLGFVLLHRTLRQDDTSHWVEERRARGHRSLLGLGVGLGLAAVVAGTLLGPSLPGARSAGVINPQGLGGGESSRVTVSPLVDIRSRLVNQSNIEVFRVRSPEPSYWRLTSLDRFDGRIWSSSGSYETAGKTLPRSVSADLPVETFDQTFILEALGAIWLPTAYEPRALDTGGVKVLYEQRSATLIVDRSADTSDGLTYQVTSSSPRLTAADLAGEAGRGPEEILADYLNLPSDFSPAVRGLATDLSAGTTSPYEAALSLQDHLRTFTYDLSVSAGHSDDVLEQFLFTTKRGYCEQFAGAFAAMARSIGLPSRVAVGFTQGVQDPEDPTLFRVRGEHAHAWPEVYFTGAGWVSFEPTPGRGQPFAEAYTGVPVSQATSGDPTTATTATPTTIASSPSSIPDASANPRTRDDDLSTQAGAAPRSRSSDGLLARFVLQPLRQALPIVGLAGAAYLVVVPLSLLVVHRIRRRRATSPSARIALAWQEVEESADMLGYAKAPSDTLQERVVRLTALLHDDVSRTNAAALAHRLEVATYSAHGADELDAELAEEASADVRRAAIEAASRKARIVRWLDPRPTLRLWRSGRPAHRQIITTASADQTRARDAVGRAG